MTAFKITHGKGFAISFENGNKVSVQFGHGNYCQNYSFPKIEVGGIDKMQREAGAKGSNTAETALLKGGDFIPYDGDKVQGYRIPEEVLELLNFAAGNPVNGKELLAALEEWRSQAHTADNNLCERTDDLIAKARGQA